jgi:serine/threonine protein kinase
VADPIAKEPNDRSGDPAAWDSPPTDPFGVVSTDCQEDHSHPLVGQLIGGKFRIVSLLSRGAHGLVFKAVQASIDREVAIKVLRPDVGADREDEFKERFLREARLAGQLQHPNIVTIHDFGAVEGGSCFIALELLRGQTLHDLLTPGPLPVRRALSIFTQLCQALIHSHERGILHRDIKPSNVFVSDRDFVKLFDFGLVKTHMPHEEITDAGTFMGTPHYAAPEQIRGGSIDARMDLYAMGVLMYRTLAGRLPFRGASWVSVVLQHLEEPYPPIATVSPEVDVPRDVEAIIERCLLKDPALRYANGRELLAALERQIAVLDKQAYERAHGAPPSGVVESFEPEPTHDDGTLETGDVAPLTPLSTPIPSPPARIQRRIDPHPAVFAGACLAIGLVVLLAFATRPSEVNAPPSVEHSETAQSLVNPAPAAAQVAVDSNGTPVKREPERGTGTTLEPVVASTPVSETATARTKTATSKPVSATSTGDATIATSGAAVIPNPAVWTGVWRGRAKGRTVAFDLTVRTDGTIRGKLERRIGDVTQVHAVQGTVTAGGNIQILDTNDDKDGTVYNGSIKGKTAEGDVVSDGKARGRWSVARE